METSFGKPPKERLDVGAVVLAAPACVARRILRLQDRRAGDLAQLLLDASADVGHGTVHAELIPAGAEVALVMCRGQPGALYIGVRAELQFPSRP